MILLEDTIRILKDLPNHNIEMSGKLEVNELNTMDIVGLLVNGKEMKTSFPLGNILFHTHILKQERINNPPSCTDFMIILYIYYINKCKINYLIIAPEGIYTYNLTNKIIKELDNIKNRKLTYSQFLIKYNQLYYSLKCTNELYIFTKKFIINSYKSAIKLSTVNDIYKEHCINMIKSAKEGITEDKYYRLLKKLGYDLKLYKWNDKRMDIKLLKGTQVTDDVLSFYDKKWMDKFRKECSK